MLVVYANGAALVCVYMHMFSDSTMTPLLGDKNEQISVTVLFWSRIIQALAFVLPPVSPG